MKKKSSLVMVIMVLVLAAPCLSQSAEAAIETEGTLRGRGFIYLPTNYPQDIGYVDVSIRVQLMRHTGVLRPRASFEYTVFSEYYVDPIRTLRDADVTSFNISDSGNGHKATVGGSATYQEGGTPLYSVPFEAVFYDDDGDGYTETFTVSVYLSGSWYTDAPSDPSLFEGRISLRP